MFRKNVAGQFLYFAMVTTAGAADTGATVTVKRCIDGGAQANGGGTVTHRGGGQYEYAMTQADTNGNDISFLFTATGDVPVEKTIVTTAADPTDAVAFGITRIDAAISSRMATFSLPANFAALAISAAGRAEADLKLWLGVAPLALAAQMVQADVEAINALAAAADILRRTLIVVHRGSVTGAATTTTLIDSTLTGPDADQYKGRIVIFEGNVTAGMVEQASNITGFNPATDQLTFTALTQAPASGDRYVIV